MVAGALSPWTLWKVRLIVLSIRAYHWVMQKPFSPHGEQRTAKVGQVLVTHVTGHWNLEMQQHSMRQTQALVDELNHKGPWASVVVVEKTLVTSLDVLEAGRNAVAQNPSMRIVGLAWVIKPDVEGYGLLLPRYRGMYEGLIRTQVFDDYSAALHWAEKIVADTPAAGDAS